MKVSVAEFKPMNPSASLFKPQAAPFVPTSNVSAPAFNPSAV